MTSWILQETQRADHEVLMEELGISGVEARMLLTRGLSDPLEARRFLYPSPDHLHDPFLFSEMKKAVELLEETVEKGMRILVHGDYDADGICGASLIYKALQKIGADVHFFVPDRAKDGYGLADRVMERGIAAGMKLVISVDCGSSDEKIIDSLAENGVRTIITDHHEVSSRIDSADAFLNPKLPAEGYPFKELAGVGVAFKLLQGFERHTGRDLGLEEMLDYVAIGTLGDYSLLCGENRTLVHIGLRQLAKWERKGFASLQKECNLPRSGFSARQICFTIVPRLNSPGRIGSARDVVELLTTEDGERAASIASQIEEMNSRRRSLDSVVTEEASYIADIVIKKDDPSALVFSSASWHEGVVGIGAARLVEKYGRPAVLIAVKGGFGKGSVRSPGFLNVKAALERCSEYLKVFGGHREAGGFTIPEENIPGFSAMFNKVAGEMLENADDVKDQLYDAEVMLGQCDMKLVEFIELMSPFGPGNEEPLMMIRELEVLPGSRIVGNGHLRVKVKDPVGDERDMIGFSLARAWNPVDIVGRRIDALVTLRRNNWQGREEAQLQLKQLRYSEIR